VRDDADVADPLELGHLLRRIIGARYNVVYRTMRIFAQSIALGVALVGLAAPAAAQAQPDFEAAKRHFMTGKDLFVRKAFLKAAEEFNQAYEMTRDPVLLFNVAEAYENAGRREEAIRFYEGYLAGVPSAQDREDVERKITWLKRERSGWQAPPPAPTPSEPPAQTTSPTGAVPPGAGENPNPPSGTEEASGGSRLRTAAWVGVGLTAALLTTAGMFALAAQSKEDDITRRQHFVDPMTGQPLDYNSGSNASDLGQLYDDGRSFKNLSIAFFVVAGATAAGTVTLFLLDHYHWTSARAEAKPRLRVGAIAVPGAGQVSLGWSF